MSEENQQEKAGQCFYCDKPAVIVSCGSLLCEVRKDLFQSDEDEIKSLRSQLTTANERAEKADNEIRGVLEITLRGHTIQVREGGGPESLYASLAISVASVVNKLESAETSLAAAQKEVELRRLSIEQARYVYSDDNAALECLDFIQAQYELMERERLALTPKPEAKG